MAVDVIMPQMGESIFEGTITKWLKKPGDRIERDEPLFEISTDKVDAEIPAPSAGVLKEIKVTEGKTVPIQTVVAVIEAEGVSTAAPAAVPAATPAPAPPKAETPKAAAPVPAAAAPLPQFRRTPPQRLPRLPQASPRRHAPTAKRFEAPHWSAASPKNTTWTSAKSKEAARADESARKTSPARSVESGGTRNLPHLLRRLRPRLPFPRRLSRRPRGFRPGRAAQCFMRRWKTPSLARGFTSAILKRSP